MNYISREQKFRELFPDQPAFRWKQAQQAFFQPQFDGWNRLSNLPVAVRQKLNTEIPWTSYGQSKILTSRSGDTHKAVLTLSDGGLIETVLMSNRRGQLTVCMSCQVGCAMGCLFCATGKMGLARSLDAEEIVDQYRFWNYFLAQHPELPQRISNVVLMGMGEPLANYENVKKAINHLLCYTDLGLTRITVSTIGIFPALENILLDEGWPNVKMAISLHAADLATRKKIMPLTPDDFFVRLTDWCRRYLEKYGNRRHHLSFEYIMISGLNDSLASAEKLVKFISQFGRAKVNLIPCNRVAGSGFEGSPPEKVRQFFEYLNQHGVTATVRKTMGDDISASCGQLITAKNK